MELIFNELSETPLCSDKTEAFNRVDRLIETYKAAHQIGFNRIRFYGGYEEINLLNDYTLNDYCNEKKHSRTKGSLLRGVFKKPYIDDNSVEEQRYIESSFSIRISGAEIAPYGLAAAFLYSTPAIGFLSEKFWEDYLFNITVKTTTEEVVTVYCISKPEHCKEQSLIDFIETKFPIILQETPIDPKNKPIKLRDDHGKDKLKEFAEQIRNSRLVVSVINSLPYNSDCRKFIKKVHPDGKIEIVLTKTDEGLGIIVQTIGKNYRETEEIAKILREKFDG